MMTTFFPSAIVEQSIDRRAYNQRGEFRGKSTAVTCPADTQKAGYIIVSNNTFDGRADRYFAIPASSRLVDLTENETITFKVTRNELSLAKGIPAARCSPVHRNFAPSIYELNHYEERSKQPQ